VAGKYNKKYRKIREENRVSKVFKLKKYRERANKYWKNSYRLCGKKEETMEHVMQGNDQTKGYNKTRNNRRTGEEGEERRRRRKVKVSELIIRNFLLFYFSFKQARLFKFLKVS
jgi:hypothetical protein